MRFKRALLIFAIFFLFAGVTSRSLADEGMWMPHQMKDLNLKDLGLKMKPDDLYKKDGTGLMSAVVYLGGGTGGFVSREGLILTNHHVAFGALQRASTEKKDLIKNGFIAWGKGEEISAKGYIADVLLGYEKVTDEVLSNISPQMTYMEKYNAVDRAKKKLIARAEKEGKDIRCNVASMYSGNEYYLFRFKRIKDIRLVYAPPQDLGNFGGDIDNWMWPRHTCDFAFLRAYVSEDNVGVDFSPDNVPYKPKSVLKISIDGFKEGDFTFVMGYPGRTYRNYTLSELQFDMDTMLKRMEIYKDTIAFFEKAGEESREIQIKYARLITGLNNSLKNYQGKIEGMGKISVVDRKKSQEKDFLEWVNKDRERQKKCGEILGKVKNFMQKYSVYYWKNNLLSGLVSPHLGSTLLAQGYKVWRTAEERQKPDMEREPSYQERDLPFIKMRIQLAEKGYDLKTDRSFLMYTLKKLFDRPEDQVPAAFKEIIGKHSEKAVDDYVDHLYDKTSLADPKKRLELLDKKPVELMKLNDPILNLAAELEKEMKVLREEKKALDQERLEMKKVYVDSLMKLKEGRIAPDANSTIRFTYGFVEGYYPKDAVYYFPQTALKGVIEKDTGKFPFHVPEKLKELFTEKDFGPYIDKKLKDIPACFLNTTNVTGGNSGSPTLNTKGEQVGIIFDMTYESVIGDYYIVPELQRTISVDIRYVLFITDKFSGAKHIIKELGY
ncbi:MAG: S46 family peptidase [Candidatus Aminicenantes bacterium]|nr:MAG: S46 family peptidase [Candidatus Aminicenantes bacterium]